jgi:hypothetical protein
MSKNKNLIGEIKNLMVKYGFATEDVKQFKLKDNTIISTVGIAKGNTVDVINEDFTKSKLKDGEYRVENLKFNVKNSVIELVNEIFMVVKLVDGNELKVVGDELVEGATIFVITEEGEVPAPDGSHELEDGTIISTSEGLVVSITLPELVEEMEEDEDKEEELEEDQVSNNELKDLMVLIEDLMKRILSLQERVDVFSENLDGIKDEFSKFKKEPATKPLNQFKKDVETNDEDALTSKLNAIMKFKNNK